MQLRIAAKPSVICRHLAKTNEELGGDSAFCQIAFVLLRLQYFWLKPFLLKAEGPLTWDLLAVRVKRFRSVVTTKTRSRSIVFYVDIVPTRCGLLLNFLCIHFLHVGVTAMYQCIQWLRRRRRRRRRNLFSSNSTNQMQMQIIYNTTEPGYRKTRRSTMPATLTHQLLE